MSRNQVLLGIVVLALLALGVGYYFYTQSSPPPVVAVVNNGVVPGDRTLGSPKAPITLIEYAAPMCPHCAHFNADVVPHLISDYVNTGKVYYVFRVFPIGAADVPAEELARCQPADNYFQFIDLLFRNQAKWDPENGVTDVHAALVALGRIAGMSPEQVDACMNNQDEQKRIMAVAQDAVARYGVSGTPTLVINGEVQEAGGMPWTVLKAKLDSMLAKK
ncbi:MAG TPA: thioredoxin domain-containing protein [Rhizomicrobium sp.]|nr:thioredoxin domain-containing protein [Rhizomicrobium sp.]